MSEPPILPREFYQRPTALVARSLLGKLLVRNHSDGRVVARLTEVEAYLGTHDPACHTFGGRRTARTETMWGEAGHAYVYLVYGLHNCLNVVTVGREMPEAVLVRGAVVEQGVEIVRERRGARVPRSALTDGPGKLCHALAVTRDDDGADLCAADSALTVRDDGVQLADSQIHQLPRVGVDYAGIAAGWPLRFVADGHVAGPR